MKPMTFEDALYNLKLGKNMARTSWNPSYWVFMAPEAAVTVPHKYGGGYHVMASLWMKTANDALVPWVISQEDVLAEDWLLIESPVREDQKQLRHA